MAPQTRSMAKASPGRSTRNSVYGRPTASPSKLRSRSPDKSAAHAQAHGMNDRVTPNGPMRDTVTVVTWQESDGVMTTVIASQTGKGTHIRWTYPNGEVRVDQQEEAEVEMVVDDLRDVTLVPPGPSDAVHHVFPQTPLASHPYDAGSVVLTPIKKGRPLQPSPPRLGDKGIRCVYEKGPEVLIELNGAARSVNRQPPAESTAILSRKQVEHLERIREDEIIQVQTEKLLARERQMEEEEGIFSDGGYDSVEMEEVPIFSSLGSQGEMLDQYGRQMLGPEGTILIDSTYGEPNTSLGLAGIADPTSNPDGFHRPRFGPQGTELVY